MIEIDDWCFTDTFVHTVGQMGFRSDLQRYRNEVKDKTSRRYVHAEIRTRVVVICGPTRYQLDHGGDASYNDRGT